MNASTSNEPNDKAFAEYYAEVKTIEKADAVLTSSQQIERLLKPGAKYLNLNPYEVLQLDSTVNFDAVKKQYRKLSILLHPDKNMDDRERAQETFDIVTKAYKTLEDPEKVMKVRETIKEAKAWLDMSIRDKKRTLKRQGKSQTVDEDDPIKFEKALKLQIVKVFADHEKRRQELDDKKSEETKREREAEIEAKESEKLQKEWAKNFEAGKAGKKEKKRKSTSLGFKPPKHKAEKR